MAVGTGGAGGNPPPNILPTQKIKITIYKSVYSNKAKIDSHLNGYWKSHMGLYYCTKLYCFEI